MYYLWARANPITKKIIFFKLIRLYNYFTSNKSAHLIRKEFVNYFTKNLNHNFIRSSPVFPITDQSLTFTNAGMNQFKGIFLNYYEPPVTKVVNSQKCIRVSGKHNDLSVVGNDSYHHTFFEMLGNWSFGDYFKEDACLYTWNLLTNVYGIPKEYLYVTYFGGNKDLDIAPDLECKDIWLRLGLPECRILPFDIHDNFWEMGISGPCGPCTEIHVDFLRRSTNEAARVNKGYADLMELWNIVFVQYERLENGNVIPLPKHHVDTGMGLERLVTFLQGKTSNYDTDIFQPLFHAIQKYSNAPEYKGTFNSDDIGKIDYGYRILADHARMVTVALADNMLPEQHPKLRKILRNAIDIGERIFRKTDILTKLIYNVADNLGETYTELHSNIKQVEKIIKFEEDLFNRLRNTSGKKWNKMVKIRPELGLVTDWTAPGLLNGYKDLQTVLKELSKTNVLPGNVAFKMYDTYGLNSETIAELAQIESLYFDEVDFQKHLDIHKYRSKIGSNKYNTVFTDESLRILEENHVPKTNDSFKYDYTYDGNNYKFLPLNSKIVGIIISGKLVASTNYSRIAKSNDVSSKITINVNDIINSKDEIGIILDKTVCYSFEGGQASDKGNIRIKNLLFNIHNVRKVNGYVIHFGQFEKTDISTSELYLKMEDDCLVNIDSQIRIGTMKHHTAAHLLNATLKEVMHTVYQRSCTVDKDSLKLQFNPFGEKLTLEQMKTIEDRINNIIRSHVTVTIQTLNSLQLLGQDDITLVPGEIYPYTDIRIIEINTDDLKAKEACCGTHVHNVGVLQCFYFLTYASKGTNCTVKAVVGPKALHIKQASEKIQHQIMELENTLQSDEFTYEAFEAEVNRIKQEISDQTKQASLPYLFEIECLTHLKNLCKTKWLQVKENEKAFVNREITAATNSSCFIVHCLSKSPTYLSLNEVVSLFSGIPILVLTHNNGLMKARCSIPQELVSNTFNAQTWMDIILKNFNAEYGPVKGFEPMLVASMKSKNIPHEYIQIHMKRAIAEATKFALIHLKKS